MYIYLFHKYALKAYAQVPVLGFADRVVNNVDIMFSYF